MRFLPRNAIVTGVIFILASGCCVKASNGDFQQWTDLYWSQILDYGLQPSFRFESRFEKDASEFSYYEIEPMLNWRYSPRWEFALGFERDERVEIEDEEEIVNIPNINVLLKLSLKKWLATNLFRMEFMFPEREEDSSVTYRNRTQLQTTWMMGAQQITPFVFEEWFLNLNEAEITQNRCGIGVGTTIVPHWMAQLYLMRLDEKMGESWEWHPVLGFQILAQF
jgi:hypothetical protein